jgi:DNA-binding transcriptional LysR family regulator
MDNKDIRSFVECYEARSINKAAKALFITPQGLGKILDRLEREMQIELFERTKQGLIPTEAGVFFYEKSQMLLAIGQELEQGLEALRNQNNVFHVGYSCGLLRLLPMHKIEKYQNLLGDTELVLEEASNPDVKKKLVEGQFDVALCIGRVAAASIVEQEISRKSMCAVVPKGHKFYDRKSLTIKDLKKEQIISLNEKYQSYTNLINTCEREGFCQVVDLYKYADFVELYKHHNKISIGYKEDETANPDDMFLYYSREDIEKYGVVGIEITVIAA